MNESTNSNTTRELLNHFTRVVADLHPALLKQAIRPGIRRAATYVRKEARAIYADEVKSLGHRADKAIDAKVHRDLSGFRVRVLRSGPKAMVRNSRGLEKPLPLFLEHNTDLSENPLGRMTKGFGRKRRGHATGVITGAAAMEKTYTHIGDASIDSILVKEIEKASERILLKYGL